MACWKTRPKVHVAGVPLSSVAADCRLVGPFGFDGVWKGGTACAFSSWFGLGWRANDGSLVVYGGSSFPIPWKRGSPLAPVVEKGQVDLVLTGFESHGQSLQTLWLI